MTVCQESLTHQVIAVSGIPDKQVARDLRLDDDPAVVAAIDVVRWELSLIQWTVRAAQLTEILDEPVLPVCCCSGQV
jgi:hypothetical protein